MSEENEGAVEETRQRMGDPGNEFVHVLDAGFGEAFLSARVLDGEQFHIGRQEI
ncbi:hypothetical protein SAZ11_51855 [Streptomyces sp. FXJ1.4098]|nr:hypothetical protein [Streptomyces sp. FXJ1.4098]